MRGTGLVGELRHKLLRRESRVPRARQHAHDLRLLGGLATIEKTVGMGSDLAASFLTNLGLARWKLERLFEARTTLERALAIATKRGPETSRVATLHFNLALVLWDLKQPVLSRTHVVASAELYRKLGDEGGAKSAMEIVAVIDEK